MFRFLQGSVFLKAKWFCSKQSKGFERLRLKLFVMHWLSFWKSRGIQTQILFCILKVNLLSFSCAEQFPHASIFLPVERSNLKPVRCIQVKYLETCSVQDIIIFSSPLFPIFYLLFWLFWELSLVESVQHFLYLANLGKVSSWEHCISDRQRKEGGILKTLIFSFKKIFSKTQVLHRKGLG